MRRESLVKEVEIPEGVTVTYENKVLKAVGPKGEVSKAMSFPGVEVKVADGKVIIKGEGVFQKMKMNIGTMYSHAKNIIQGAAKGYVYKLKICSGHFPMKFTVKGDTAEVVNYIGEKVARTVKVKPGAKVKVEGDIITVEAADKELAGQVAGDLELLTKLTNKDRRIYQDGIYITEKNGKVM